MTPTKMKALWIIAGLIQGTIVTGDYPPLLTHNEADGSSYSAHSSDDGYELVEETVPRRETISLSLIEREMHKNIIQRGAERRTPGRYRHTIIMRLNKYGQELLDKKIKLDEAFPKLHEALIQPYRHYLNVSSQIDQILGNPQGIISKYSQTQMRTIETLLQEIQILVQSALPTI